MASDKPCFLQPVEIKTSNQNLTVDSTPYTIPSGVYPSVLAVMYELDQQLGGTYDWSISYDATSDSLRAVASNSSTMVVSWTDSDLATLLGFETSPLSGSTSYTAPVAPQKCWIPKYVPTKRDGWKIEQNKAVKGTNTTTGNYVGNRSTLDRHLRDYDFVHELSSNVLDTHTTSETEGSKTFEAFGISARSEVATVATGVSLKGFYIVHEIGNADSDDTDFRQADADSGGININYTFPDKYTFAAFRGDAIRVGDYSLPSSFERMSLSFAVITAVAPGWS